MNQQPITPVPQFVDPRKKQGAWLAQMSLPTQVQLMMGLGGRATGAFPGYGRLSPGFGQGRKVGSLSDALLGQTAEPITIPLD